MTVSQIYQKYMTPKNLQEHMLRVTALAKIITDNWTGEDIDSMSVIKACLMHDIAKPVGFNTSPENQKKYNMSDTDIQNQEKLKKYIKDNFGEDEHKAATEMCKTMNLGEGSVSVVDKMEWSYLPGLMKENDLNTIIAVYCDMRIGPNGILSLQERFDNLKARTGKDHSDLFADALEVENVLQKNSNIDLNGITDPDLNSLFSDLVNIEI